jgi:predicted DNA-binding transcriptional regulator YafY
VDRRTLRRYVGKLEDIGIPITAERGRAGGYALMPGFKLPPMMFTEDETLALSLGLLAARGLGLAEAAPAVASAQAKLERVMPDGLKRRVRAVGDTVKLDAARTIAPANNQALVALTNAAQACRRVVLRYRDQAGEESVRRFDPYGLALRHGRWYAAGMCHLRQALRTFRLDRIADVAPLAEPFERPPGFDAMAHVIQAVATLPRAFAIEVLLKTDIGRGAGALVCRSRGARANRGRRGDPRPVRRAGLVRAPAGRHALRFRDPPAAGAARGGGGVRAAAAALYGGLNAAARGGRRLT